MRRIGVALGLAIAVASLGIGRGAHADEAPPAAASDRSPDAHVTRAKAALASGDRASALEALQRAWQLRPDFEVAELLGKVELDLGKRADAAHHLSFALRTFPTDGLPAARAELQAKLDPLRRELAAVRVRVNIVHAIVRVGGREVGVAPVEDPIFFEPSQEITVEATATFYLPARKTLSGAAGSSQDIALVLLADTPEVSPEPVNLTGALLLGGLALVAVGVGVGLVAASSSVESDIENGIAREPPGSLRCDTDAASARCAELEELVSQRNTLVGIGVGAFITGGISAVAALAQALPGDPKVREPRAGVRVLPIVGASDAMVRVELAW